MDDHSDGTRRINGGRRLITNPRAALRSGFQSLPSATVAHLFRHVPPIGSTPSAPPAARPPVKPGPNPGHQESKREPGMSRIENGSSFAGYTILRPLGAGGMAEVFLALHPRLPRRDVIKVLAEAITADSEFRERFNREADLAATLWHPHIVGVHDRGEFDGQLWISMDYVAGTDASRLVKERYSEGMPVQEVSAILTAVAGALDYAHDRGLLHRDVKPANILLSHADDEERRVLLAAFGVARHLASVSGITETNVAVGTVAYAAPEQLTGCNIDGRADQYALAATAFHLLTGAPPFRHPNPVAVISQHLHDDPPLLSDFRPELDYLDDVFRKALAKDPEDRFDRCRGFSAAVREDMTAAGDGDEGQYVAPGPPWRRTPGGVVSAAAHKFSPRARWAALLCAVLVAVAATWSILYTFQSDSSAPKAALAARPAAPAAAAAKPARVLNGTYRLDYDRSKRTTNGTPLRHAGAASNFWAFQSACNTNGCAATGVALDDATHQVASTADGGQSDTLRFVAGYWQGAPAQERVGCTQANGPVHATQAETVAWSLAPQPDGSLRGVETETVTSNECGAQGAVVRVPVVATRVGDAPPKLALPDPTQAITAPTTPAGKPSPPVLGGICSDADKLGYDQTSNEQVVCEGNAWSKAPITTGGVHAAGSSCDRPDIPVFAMATSNDGYLLQCDPVTRTWTRHN
jgi:serine/threonine-protein kinase